MLFYLEEEEVNEVIEEVKREPSPVPPEFSEALEKQSLTEGDTLTLKCTVRGLPEPTVEWFVDGQNVKFKENIKIKFRAGICTLIISEVTMDDSGEYICKATNDAGQVSTEATVHVKSNVQIDKAPPMDLPKFSRHPQGLILNDGDPAIIECAVIGNPEITWYKGDEIIRDTEDFKYEQTGEVHRLIIAEVFPEDSGVYRAEASNSTGTTSSHFTLLINVPEEEPSGPQFIEFPRSQTVDESTPVKFSCSFDEIERVSWMKDGREIDDTGRFRFEDDGNSRSFVIPAALATDSGIYTVEANNARGNSVWTFTLNVNVSASPCADIDVLSLIESVQ